MAEDSMAVIELMQKADGGDFLVAVVAEETGHLGPHGRFDHVLDHRAENGIEVVQVDRT